MKNHNKSLVWIAVLIFCSLQYNLTAKNNGEEKNSSLTLKDMFFTELVKRYVDYYSCLNCNNHFYGNVNSITYYFGVNKRKLKVKSNTAFVRETFDEKNRIKKIESKAKKGKILTDKTVDYLENGVEICYYSEGSFTNRKKYVYDSLNSVVFEIEDSLNLKVDTTQVIRLIKEFNRVEFYTYKVEYDYGGEYWVFSSSGKLLECGNLEPMEQNCIYIKKMNPKKLEKRFSFEYDANDYLIKFIRYDNEATYYDEYTNDQFGNKLTAINVKAKIQSRSSYQYDSLNNWTARFQFYYDENRNKEKNELLYFRVIEYRK